MTCATSSPRQRSCDDGALDATITEVLRRIDGVAPTVELPVDVRGTAFQQQVWRELVCIPRGETRTYREVAEAVGKPLAARAVGNACGSNPVAIVVPCHRVVASDGGLGGFGWGLDRKRLLLDNEYAAVPGKPEPEVPSSG